MRAPNSQVPMASTSARHSASALKSKATIKEDNDHLLAPHGSHAAESSRDCLGRHSYGAVMPREQILIRTLCQRRTTSTGGLARLVGS